MTRRPILSLLAATLLAPAAATAASGETWEITSQMEMPGMPFAMPPTTQRFCKPAGDWTNPPAQQEKSSDCKVTDVKRSGNTMRWKVACTGKQKMSGDGEMTWTASAYTGAMNMHTGDGDMKMKTRGRKLGTPCDPGAQKRELDARVAQIQGQAREQQAQAARQQAEICEKAGQDMSVEMFLPPADRTPAYCTDATRKGGFCDRLRTRPGFRKFYGDGQGKERQAKAGTLCHLGFPALQATLCKEALQPEDLDFIGLACPAQTKALVKRECAGRTYTGEGGNAVSEKYRGFCSRYAAEELRQEGAKRKAVDGAADQGKQLLKGVLGF